MNDLQQQYQDKLEKKAAAEAEVARMIEENKEKERIAKEEALAKKKALAQSATGQASPKRRATAMKSPPRNR